jgi:hypothetical protein
MSMKKKPTSTLRSHRKPPTKTETLPEAPPASGDDNGELPKYLEKLYKPQLKKLVELFSVSAEGERGFYTGIAHAINLQLAKHKLKIASTFANDLHTGRKIGRDGVSLSLAYRLGVLLSGKPDPARAIALFYIWAGGLWPDKAKASAILEAIQGAEMDYKEFLQGVEGLLADYERRQDKKLDEKLDKILQRLESKNYIGQGAVKFHPLSAALRELNPKSADETAETIAQIYEGYPESAEHMRRILLTGETLPDREFWLDLGYTMSALTGEVWPPQKIAELATQAAGLESQVSSSEDDPVQPK